MKDALRKINVVIMDNEKVYYMSQKSIKGLLPIWIFTAIVFVVSFFWAYLFILAGLLVILSVVLGINYFSSRLVVTNMRVAGMAGLIRVDIPLSNISAVYSTGNTITIIGAGFATKFLFTPNAEQCRYLIVKLMCKAIDESTITYKYEEIKPIKKQKRKVSIYDEPRELPALLKNEETTVGTMIPTEEAFSTTFEMVSKTLHLLSKPALKSMKSQLMDELKIADSRIESKASKDSDEYKEAKRVAYFRYLDDKRVIHGCHTYVECEAMLEKINNLK